MVSHGLFLPVHGLETLAMVIVPPLSMTKPHPHTVTHNPSSDAYRTRTPNAQEASSALRTKYGAGAWGEPVFAQPGSHRPCSSKEPAAVLEPTVIRRERIAGPMSFSSGELQKLL